MSDLFSGIGYTISSQSVAKFQHFIAIGCKIHHFIINNFIIHRNGLSASVMVVKFTFLNESVLLKSEVILKTNGGSSISLGLSLERGSIGISLTSSSSSSHSLKDVKDVTDLVDGALLIDLLREAEGVPVLFVL